MFYMKGSNRIKGMSITFKENAQYGILELLRSWLEAIYDFEGHYFKGGVHPTGTITVNLNDGMNTGSITIEQAIIKSVTYPTFSWSSGDAVEVVAGFSCGNVTFKYPPTKEFWDPTTKYFSKATDPSLATAILSRNAIGTARLEGGTSNSKDALMANAGLVAPVAPDRITLPDALTTGKGTVVLDAAITAQSNKYSNDAGLALQKTVETTTLNSNQGESGRALRDSAVTAELSTNPEKLIYAKNSLTINTGNKGNAADSTRLTAQYINYINNKPDIIESIQLGPAYALTSSTAGPTGHLSSYGPTSIVGSPSLTLTPSTTGSASPKNPTVPSVPIAGLSKSPLPGEEPSSAYREQQAGKVLEKARTDAITNRIIAGTKQ